MSARTDACEMRTGTYYTDKKRVGGHGTSRTLRTPSSSVVRTVRPRPESQEASARLSKDACDIPETVINGRFSVGKQIGKGSFGEVREGVDRHTGNRVAIKLERRSSPAPQLAFEALAYMRAAPNREPAWRGVPCVYAFDDKGPIFNVMVMQRLGKSLEQKFAQCDRTFSIRTICMIADQMLIRIEHVHSVGLLHRDIKPDNIMVGGDDEPHALYLIDFGLVKQYCLDNGDHIPPGPSSHTAGTVRYASLAAQRGMIQSRRDDLESLAYVLIYFARGRLPWQGLRAAHGGGAPHGGGAAPHGSPTSDREAKRMKESMPVSDIVGGAHAVLGEFLTYTRKLEFTQKPDYAGWRVRFRRAANVDAYDGRFDWLSNT